MNKNELISIDELCSTYEVELTFVDTLQDYGLIEVVSLEERMYLPQDHLADFEKMWRLHLELGINAEALDVINNLLGKISEMEKELRTLKNKYGE